MNYHTYKVTKGLTDFRQAENAIREAMRRNQELYSSQRTKWLALVKLAIEVYGSDGKETIYLRNHPVPQPPPLDKELKKLRTLEAEANRLQTARVHRRQLKERREQRAAEALAQRLTESVIP